MDRRRFLAGAGLFIGASLVSCSEDDPSVVVSEGDDASTSLEPASWPWVRNQFDLSPDKIHCSGLLVSSHPAPVRQAIDQYRKKLNADPVTYLEDKNNEGKRAVRRAAGEYLGTEADNIALTDSTTMGISLVYNGLQLSPGDEIITTEHDYYATHESLRLAAERTGASVRKIRLYEDSSAVSVDEIRTRVKEAITPDTRALALTWVHSNTGVKLPLAEISDVVSDANSDREPSNRILTCVDGVHGFGVENFSVDELGIDFFISGCHKWLFGPRGTGIVWGRSDAWARLLPTIPSFMSGETWQAWATETDPRGRVTAARMSPGGFKPFEHQWAVADAFEFHQRIGKQRVEDRTHQLARQLTEGLVEIPGLTVHTPTDQNFSAGIVCFDIDGMTPGGAIQALRSKGIIATTTPYQRSYARLTPSIRNTPEEIDTILDEVRALV